MAILFQSIPAEFISEYSLEESIERLRGVVKWSVFQALFQEAAVGRVSKRRVSIRRDIPLVGNPYKPHFIGKFECKSGQVFLTGVFTFGLLPRMFMAIWFGFLGIFCLMVLGKSPPNAELMLLAVAGIGGAGLGFMHFANWLSRHDIAWLSSLIGHALSRENATELDTSARPCVQTRHSGTSMNVFKVLVFFSALIVLTSAVTGVRGFHKDQVGNMVITEHTALGRGETILVAAVAVAFLYGLHTRALLTWKAGWGLLILSILGGIANATVFLPRDAALNNPPRPPHWFFLIGGCAVGVYWGLWWKNQRDYFRSRAENEDSSASSGE